MFGKGIYALSIFRNRVKSLRATNSLSVLSHPYNLLAALSEQRKITERDLLQGIQRELQKEGKEV